MPPRGASAAVIRCFKRLEHFTDRLTGAAGPVFIALAWILTVLGGFAFFDVVSRDLSWTATVLLLPFYALVPLNMYGQYWLATHVPAGFPQPRGPEDERFLGNDPHSWLAPERWGFRRRRGTAMLNGNAFAGRRRVRRCRKCNGPKPPRTHHCSVCKRCVLLMDHHCPWINGCVGLHNQRHFILFMAWLSVGAWFVVALGWDYFWATLGFAYPYNARITPKVAFTLTYVLCCAIGTAVPILAGWHMYMVSAGETSIEGHDNDYLRRKAKKDGLIYLNPYDYGAKRNLQMFFNLGPGGYPLATLLFPFVVPPASDGWSWPLRSYPETLPKGAPKPRSSEEGGQGDGPGGLYVMGGADELTDDETGGGGWWEDESEELQHQLDANE